VTYPRGNLPDESRRHHRRIEVATDGIALAPAGRTLYDHAAHRRDAPQRRDRHMEDTGLSPGSARGAGAVRRRDRHGRRPPHGQEWPHVGDRAGGERGTVRQGNRRSILVPNKRLRWPDTISDGPRRVNRPHHLAHPSHALVQAAERPAAGHAVLVHRAARRHGHDRDRRATGS